MRIFILLTIGIFATSPLYAVLVSGGESSQSSSLVASETQVEEQEKKPSQTRGTMTLRIRPKANKAAPQTSKEAAPSQETRFGQPQSTHPLAVQVKNTSPVTKTVKAKKRPNALLRGTLRGGTGTIQGRGSATGTGSVTGTATGTRSILTSGSTN